MIEVIHLWKSDSGSRGGGGAVSMYRLHSPMREAGIDSKILCEIKTTESPNVQTLLLLLKLENLNQCAGNAFKEFLDIVQFTLVKSNTGTKKEYSSL